MARHEPATENRDRTEGGKSVRAHVCQGVVDRHLQQHSPHAHTHSS